MTSDATISKSKSGGVGPDPVIEPLLKILAPEQVTLHCTEIFGACFELIPDASDKLRT